MFAINGQKDLGVRILNNIYDKPPCREFDNSDQIRTRQPVGGVPMDSILRRLSTGDAANEKATFEVDLTDFSVVDVSGGMLAGRSHQLSADLIFLRVINLDLKVEQTNFSSDNKTREASWNIGSIKIIVLH
jgi:hypothetical protein